MNDISSDYILSFSRRAFTCSNNNRKQSPMPLAASNRNTLTDAYCSLQCVGICVCVFVRVCGVFADDFRSARSSFKRNKQKKALMWIGCGCMLIYELQLEFLVESKRSECLTRRTRPTQNQIKNDVDRTREETNVDSVEKKMKWSERQPNTFKVLFELSETIGEKKCKICSNDMNADR